MSLTPAEFIRAKRDRKRLEPDDIAAFVRAYLAGEVAEYQMSAFLMAAFLRGMDGNEAAALTKTYVESGIRIDLSSLPGTPVDKHSTGGVGDKVSLILAPLVAACGGYVPMLSGRGLGHTGGTLDKLESIPGFTTALSVERLVAQVSRIGCAIARQSDELAPADGRIYALRDVTATVESIPLICASIMSKKIAEGARGLVLDVKFGSGAFMNTMERAIELSKMLIAIGNASGMLVRAVLTDMSQPLGSAVGNALEARESILVMRREKKLPDLEIITLALAGEMLEMAGLATTQKEGEKLAAIKLDDGSALESFRKMVEAQDGDPRVCDEVGLLPSAPIVLEMIAERAGFISAINTRAIGMAAVELGAGRIRAEDAVDFGVGFEFSTKIGDYVERGQTIGLVYAKSEGDALGAIKKVQSAYEIADEKPRLLELIKLRLS